MKIIAPVSLAVAGALMLAVGTAGQPAAPTREAHVAPSCFWIRDVDNFSATDDRHLYLRVGGRNVYLLELYGNCLELSWVHNIALRSRASSNICEGRATDLDVFDREVGVGRQECPVLSVRRLTPDEVEAIPKVYRP
jgi:hypothetical protein